MMKFLILFSVTLLSACAGSAYKLPDIHPDELAEVENRLETDHSNLKIYNRSNAHYKTRVQTIAKRLERKAGPLCTHAEYSPCKFEVTYNSDDIVNAYAHENYKITVFKGFLKYLKNDDEMAALIAHEMSHHLAKHNQETLQNAQTGAAVSGLLTAVLLGAANANNPYYTSYQQQQDQQAISDMMELGAEIGAVSYSKEQEREADLIATYLLKHAGYNLNRAQNLMYVMAKLDYDEIEGHAALASTHPPTPERVVAWRNAINEIKENGSLLPIEKNQKH